MVLLKQIMLLLAHCFMAENLACLSLRVVITLYCKLIFIDYKKTLIVNISTKTTWILIHLSQETKFNPKSPVFKVSHLARGI